MKKILILMAVFGLLTAQSESREYNLNASALSSISVLPSGRLKLYSLPEDAKAGSKNGSYFCRYDIGRVSDEKRELTNFKLFEGELLLYELNYAPGSDLYISNSGVVAFMDSRQPYNNELAIHFYSKSGQHLLTRVFKRSSLFGFSPKGNKFGVGTSDQLQIISVFDGKVEIYKRGFQFDISEDEDLIAVAAVGSIKVYSNGNLIKEIETDFPHTRKVKISSEYGIVAAIDKYNLIAYSLQNGRLLFSDHLDSRQSFRDLLLKEGNVITGIQYSDDSIVKGILKVYDNEGKILEEQEKSVSPRKKARKSGNIEKSILDYPEIPWPFSPYDSMRTIWNYYEQHMGGWGPNFSYLHQGLDIITPIAEPVYAVEGGIVKCVSTLEADYHWYIAISDTQTAEYSDGWCYSHLIERTIQFDVWDTVQIHDYLGDIIQWYSNWGHLHIVEARDSGLVWYHDDENEIGINYNPLLSLRPYTDTIPPIIEDVFYGISKFGFCTNETSDYLYPDSLYGDIDIIVKVIDYIGDSEWAQPAFELYYWIENIPEGDTIFPRTIAQILNHSYDFIDYLQFEPYATLLYKRDPFLYPSDWMNTYRNYHHILTNNNGDSLGELWEKELAFSTTDYADGFYRVLVEALDEYGNSTIDSQDVYFCNESSGAIDNFDDGNITKYNLENNYPNPFNALTVISYDLPCQSQVTIDVYDLLGRHVNTIQDGMQPAGSHQVTWNAGDLPSGVYFYKLQTGDFSEARKMVVVK